MLNWTWPKCSASPSGSHTTPTLVSPFTDPNITAYTKTFALHHKHIPQSKATDLQPLCRLAPLPSLLQSVVSPDFSFCSPQRMFAPWVSTLHPQVESFKHLCFDPNQCYRLRMVDHSTRPKFAIWYHCPKRSPSTTKYQSKAASLQPLRHLAPLPILPQVAISSSSVFTPSIHSSSLHTSQPN